MSQSAPGTTGSDSGYVSVSNISDEAREAVTAQHVTEPASLGLGAQAPPPTDEGLENVPGYARAVPLERGLASVAAARAPGLWTPPESTQLRDVGEASFGSPPPMPEIVHGPDDRAQVTDTASYPWRAIASLLITARDNSTWIGTGWFVSPRTLITAGHCVFINSPIAARNGWVNRIDVMAGRNGNSLPFGSVTSTEFWSITGWTEQGNEAFDVGAIILPTPLGETVGMFGIGVYPDSELQGLLVNVSGYPGDKPTGTHWYDAQKIASVNVRKVHYDIDTAGGQSGAPVFRGVDGNRIGVAVHAYGGNTTNSGTRINEDVYNAMKSWMV
jgi:glutamyl endopeptidase